MAINKTVTDMANNLKCAFSCTFLSVSMHTEEPNRCPSDGGEAPSVGFTCLMVAKSAVRCPVAMVEPGIGANLGEGHSYTTPSQEKGPRFSKRKH